MNKKPRIPTIEIDGYPLIYRARDSKFLGIYIKCDSTYLVTKPIEEFRIEVAYCSFNPDCREQYNQNKSSK